MPISFGCGLRVHREREPRVAVPETRLRGLEVDAFTDESGCVRAPKVVKREPVKAGLRDGGEPDPATPILVAQRFAPGHREHERFGVGAGQLRAAQVFAQHQHEPGREREGASPCARFRRPEDADPLGSSSELLGNREP
jgi:hypothetical protein